MQRFFCWVTARPIAVLVVMGAMALGLATCMLWLQRDTSPDAFIPGGHPALVLKDQVAELFGVREPIAVGVIRDGQGGIFDRDTLRLIRELTRDIQQLPQVDSGDVLSLATISGVYFKEKLPGFAKVFDTIPENQREMDDLRRNVLGYELYRGTLVAADGSAACILVRPRDEARADEIYRAIELLLADYPTTDQQLVVAGEAAVRAHMGAAVSDDALRMNIICPLVMFGLIALAYRTVRGLLLPMCVIGGASAAALGSMALSGVPIYIVTNGIFVVIMAVGVADALHIVGQYYEEQLRLDGRGRKQVAVDSCMALWRPVLITSLTDVAGFFSLYVVGMMPPIRYFGLFTCIGVLGALLYSYTVLPAGLAVLPLRTSKTMRRSTRPESTTGQTDRIGALLGRIGLFTYHRWRLVLAVFAVLIGLAAWGASKMVVNDARILAFSENHPIARAANVLNERFDGTSHLNILISSEEPGAMFQPEMLRRIEALEAYTETLPHVGGTHSVAGWIKRAHQKMNGESPEFYTIPDDPEVNRYYVSVLSAEKSPMADLLGEVVDSSGRRANLIVRMKSSQFIHQRPVIERLQAYLDENFAAGHFAEGTLRAELAGRVNLDYHWLSMIHTSHVRSVCFAFAAVLLLTGLMFRSAVAGLLCTLTVGLAVLAIYAVMGFFDVPLGVGTSMFASIAIGAGVNFPIHILDRLRTHRHSVNGHSVNRHSEEDMADVFRDTFTFTGRALFFTAVVVAGGFLLLCVSEFRTLVRFGLLISAGMVVSFLASITLLPSLVAATKPRFIWGRRRESSD